MPTTDTPSQRASSMLLEILALRGEEKGLGIRDYGLGLGTGFGFGFQSPS